MHRPLPLVLLRATFLAPLPWSIAAAQVVNLGDESVAPAGARGTWFLFALKIAAFFVLLAGLVVAVLWKGRRSGQQASAADATPRADAVVARASSGGLEVALDAIPLPPRHHRWNLSYGLGGMVAAVGVVWVYSDLGAEWQLAVAGGAAGAWFVAAAAETARVPVVSLRAASARGTRAPVARGRASPKTIAIALFPSVIAVFCWAVTMTDASRALLSFALLQPIVTGVDWGRTRETFEVGEDALERRSPWLRRATRVAWRDVTRVVTSRPSPHDVTLLVWAREGQADGAERRRVAVPLALDGIGDLAAALSRRVPVTAWTASEPGTRALLDSLAPDREN